MRKRLCVLMMTLACLLVSCGGKGGERETEELLQQIRGRYLELTACCGHGELTADYGRRVYTYGIDFSCTSEGELLLTLTAPENVAGTTAHITAGETALEFDGVMLETGPLDSAGLTPIDAIPALLRYAREGFVSACAIEGEEGQQTLHVVCSDPESSPGQGVEANLWFDPATLALLRGEISTDGVTVIQCEITDFAMEAAQEE